MDRDEIRALQAHKLCKTCDGTGEVSKAEGIALGRAAVVVTTCPACRGAGVRERDLTPDR